MPPDPERVVRVKATEQGGESYDIEHETDRLPDDPKKIAEFLHRNLLEINNRNISGKGELSEEAEFVARLEAVMAEFYNERAAEIPPERRPSLSYFVSILDGSAETTLLPPTELRALMERVYERFGVPERGDLTVLEDDAPVKNQPGRIDAHRRLLAGIQGAWGKLLEASWRQYHAEAFPARVRGEVEDIATSGSLRYQQELISGLATKIVNGGPPRFRKFAKALVGASVGMKGEIVTERELRAFADYIAPRLPRERAVSSDEIFEAMRLAQPNKGGQPMSRELLSLIIEGYARDIRAVHDLADPERLFEETTETRSVFNRVRETWDLFTDPQRMQFIELVRANLVLVEPKRDEGAAARKGKSVTGREELRELCRKISKALSIPGAPVKEDDVKNLAKLIEFRVNEIVDYRTKPEEEAAVVEAGEQQAVPAATLVRETAERLSTPNAFIPPLVRVLRRDDMEALRLRVFRALRQTVASGGSKAERITTLQMRAGISFNETDVSSIETVIDSEGQSTNKAGWELLLRAGNASHEFRDLLRTGV